jgi:hypothetical protein
VLDRSFQQAAGRALIRGFARDFPQAVDRFQSCMTTTGSHVPG